MDSSVLITIATVLGAAVGAMGSAVIGRRGAQEANQMTALQMYTTNMRSDLDEMRVQRHEDIRRLEHAEALLNTAYAWMRDVASMANKSGVAIPPIPAELANHLGR